MKKPSNRTVGFYSNVGLFNKEKPVVKKEVKPKTPQKTYSSGVNLFNKKSLPRSKKGFLGDVGLIIAVLFLVAIVVIVSYKIFTSYNDKWQAAPTIDTHAKVLVQDNKDRYTSIFDGIFMFVFALLCLGLFISATLINTRPEFFFITIIVLVFMIGGAALISNSFENASTSDQLNATSSEFSFIPFLMSQLPIVTLFLGFLVIVALYVKMRGLL